MDQSLVESTRKNLEAKSSEELQAFLTGGASGRPPEEVEAARQILEERSRKRTRFALAVSSAVLLGVLAAAGAWQLGADGVFIALSGGVCAILAFVGWYINLQ